MSLFKRAPLPIWALLIGATLTFLAGYLVPLALGLGVWLWQHLDGGPTMRQRRAAFVLLCTVGALGTLAIFNGPGLRFGPFALTWLAGAVLLALLWRLEDVKGRLVCHLMTAVYLVLVLAGEPSLLRAMALITGVALMTAAQFALRAFDAVDEPPHAIAVPVAHLAWYKDPRADPRALISGALVRPTAVIAVVLTVCALTTYLVLPEPAGGGRNPMLGGAAGPGGLTSGATRSLATYSGGDLSLNTRGKLPNVAVAEVPANSPTYWRMGVLGSYLDRHWVALDRKGGGLWQGDSATSYQVTPREGFPGKLIAPGAAIGATVPVVADGSYRLALKPARSYSVTSLPYPSVRDASVGIPGDDPRDDPQDALWRQTPDSTRIQRLASTLPGSAADPAAAARGIEDYLHAEPFRYDLEAPVAPQGSDPVEYFLFESKSGFCEHYAAAAALLLRAKGIPARVATGFAGGEVDGATRLLRGTDAHAWVEVYVPGRGWVTSEPTPPATQGPFALSQNMIRVLALLLAMGVLLGAWLITRGRRLAPTPQPAPEALVLALQRVRDTLASIGQPAPPNPTVADLGRAVAAVVTNESGADDDPFAAAERHLYAPGGLSRAERDQVIRRLDEIAVALRSTEVTRTTDLSPATHVP